MKAYQIKGQYTALVDNAVVTTAIDGLCDTITIEDDRVIIDGNMYPDRIIEISEANAAAPAEIPELVPFLFNTNVP